MTLFLITALLIGLVIAIMAIGVMAGRKPIKGSCGGMGALGIDSGCEICGGNGKRCDEASREAQAERDKPQLFYRADQ